MSKSKSKSERFYWCSGCGVWHDPRKGQDFHYAMLCPYEEPNEKNFEGTPEELQRFIAARQIRKDDAAAFEKRIDDRLKNTFHVTHAFDGDGNPISVQEAFKRSDELLKPHEPSP